MDHPLRAWRLAQDPVVDLDGVAERLAADGSAPPAVAYLKNIENGADEPGIKLAMRIGALVGMDPLAVKFWKPDDSPPPEAPAVDGAA